MQATENSDKGSVGNNALQDKTYGNDATARDSVGRVLKGSIPAKVTKYEAIYANARKAVPYHDHYWEKTPQESE